MNWWTGWTDKKSSAWIEAKRQIVLTPVQKGNQIENLAINVQPGSLDGQRYDKVLVQFQFLPKMPRQEDDQFRDSYAFFIGLETLQQPKGEIQDHFWGAPVSKYRPNPIQYSYLCTYLFAFCLKMLLTLCYKFLCSHFAASIVDLSSNFLMFHPMVRWVLTMLLIGNKYVFMISFDL